MKKLIRAAASNDSAALLAQAEAVSTLRNLGHSKISILRARAGALEGRSVEEILKELEAERGAVAA